MAVPTPDASLLDPVLPSGSDATKKLADVKRRKKQPPSDPPSTPSSASKGEKEAFTPEEEVAKTHEILLKIDQNAGKRRRKDRRKKAAEDEGADADGHDSHGERSKEKTLKRRVSKRRLVMKRKNSKRSRSFEDEGSPSPEPVVEEPQAAAPKPRVRVTGKKVPTAEDPTAPAPKSAPKCKAKSKAKPVPKSAPKAKAKAARKAVCAEDEEGSKAPAPKPDAKRKSALKVKGKSSAKPAVESAEPKETGNVSKPRAKAKAGSLRPSVSNDFELDEHLMERFVAYGGQCHGEEDKFSLETKKRLRACLSTFEHSTLIIYWTRPAVALKFRKHDRTKDYFYNAFPCPEGVCYRIHMLVSIQAEFLDMLLADKPVESWPGFEEKGMAVLLDDEQVALHYDQVVQHGREAMQVLLEEDAEAED
ncbi:unnamed protein product [Symbiodinium sp. CCMP2592]|nr:unnamed protein product [Symbiodinium sp. CCMP2592]